VSLHAGPATRDRPLPPDDEPPRPTTAAVHRLRLATVCLVITVLVFTQSSGLDAADTKYDLIVTPWRFLVASISAWDPTQAAGTLQNQAYGYLFPMGPFFLLGHLVQLSPWVIQRSWESILLIAAFLGVVRLSRLLGVCGWWPQVAAGLAYALAPRMLMEIGVISSELLPVAAAPWVLIPLVRGSRAESYGVSPRRAAALSGVALLFAGGTNAAATLAILPIPILWLLTRERGPRRRALMRWWALAVGLACLWWVVPLVVLGKYSPPFLDWIESAAVTTSPTSLATTLRGAEHWEAFLGRGVWPAGYIFVTQQSVIAATALVATAGLIGIALRRTPHRFFLGCCLATGLVLITFGHVASVGPIAALTERTALDGPLNAFRNIHKFDPVIRLPIALGVGHLFTAGISRWGKRRPATATRGVWANDNRVIGAVAAVCIGVAAIAPAIAGDLVPEVHAVTEPSWWTQAARWLGHQDGGRALVVPGAAQPVYLWGEPRDDALQPVATSPWAVRDSVPLAQAGYIRLLDAIDARLAAGRDDPTLSEVLARSGIRYVVVRNDLDTAASDATPLKFIYATLNNSPGFRPVTTFGPNLLSVPSPNELIDSGATPSQPAITVYENSGSSGDVSLLPESQAVTANGSADNLPGLSAAGVTPDQPVIFAPATLPPGAGPVMSALTDGIRRREFGFGGISRYSDTMTADQPYRAVRTTHDYLPTPTPPLSTVAYLGIKDVTASSSGADAAAVINGSPANGPWSALDGNPATSWLVGSVDGALGQWLQIDMRAPLVPTTALLTLHGSPGEYPDRIRVTTAAGSLTEPVIPAGAPQPIRLPTGATRFIRLTFTGIQGGGPGYLAGITQLSIPGVLAARTLVVPGAGRPDLISFTVADGARSECLTVGGQPACDPSWAANGEEDSSMDRTFGLSASTTYDTHAMVRLRPGRALDRLLDRGDPLQAVASSVDSADPRGRPGAAVDGNPSTGWLASPDNLRPTIVVSTPHKTRLTGVSLTALQAGASRAPVEVRVSAGHESVDQRVPGDGVIYLPHPVKARRVTIHVIRATLRTTTSSTTGKSAFLPVGIAEIDLLGPHVPVATANPDVTLTCDDGVTLFHDGVTTPLEGSAASASALAGDPMTLTPCATAATRALHLPPEWLLMPRGPQHVALPATSVTLPANVVMSRVGQPRRPTPIALPVTKLAWSATNRSVRVQTAVAALLVVHENVNAGWRATVDGRTLPAVTVDGWQQAWVVPAGTVGVIHLRFVPQRIFIAGLLAGALAVLLLVALALPLRRFRRRSSPPRATRGRAPPAPVGWVLTVVALTLLGSVVGFLVAACLIAVQAVSRHGSRVTEGRLRANAGLWVIGATLVAVAAGETLATVSSAHPLAGSAGLQVLCLVAVGVVLLRCLVAPADPPGAGEAAQ
jgi:arabinofuranan 3-O-arabinosyltransferase